MLPIQLIAGLFTATIVGATGKFARSDDFSLIVWFMYLYLVGYRVKVFLDDLVYYQTMKRHAIGGGEPIIGLISWLLWLATGIVIGDATAYFGLTGATFALGIVWVTIANRNVPKQPSRDIEQYVDLIRSAHSRWWKFNLVPAIIGLFYFFLFASGVTPEWSKIVWWTGPLLMATSFVWDVASGYRFMFTKID
jgi:hypothetical protein